MTMHYSDSSVTLHHGDCLDVLRSLPDASIDSVVTDPPYGLEFMGKGWDAPWQQSDINGDAGFHGGGISQTKGLPSFTGSTNPKCLTCKGTRRGRRDGTAKVAVCLCADGGRFPNHRAVEMRAFGDWCELWTSECLRVLKPGGHLLAFGGSRTWHRLASAIEDSGFEVRDSIAWLYGSGFPKSLNLLDESGERTGWGTALKPAFEPVVVARKPLQGTVAGNVLQHGTGALNIDGTRIGTESTTRTKRGGPKDFPHEDDAWTPTSVVVGSDAGRWPANVILDESQAEALDEQSGTLTSGVLSPANNVKASANNSMSGPNQADRVKGTFGGDVGGASRFFYVAKADQSERPRVNGTAHPTVKPIDLMRWLVRLVTPPGGTVLEPFAGSGTTVEACIVEGFHCIAIEREADYLPLIEARIARRRDPVKAITLAGEDLGLFGEVGA